MKTLYKLAGAFAGAMALAAALPAAASSTQSITMQARQAFFFTGFSSQEYVDGWNAALAAFPAPPGGSSDQSIRRWDGQSNSVTGGGSICCLSYHDQALFTVDADEAGVWSFRVNPDFGVGGTLRVDGIELDTKAYDIYDPSFTNPGQYLLGSILLGAGSHSLDVYGYENCCDGIVSGQYRTPGGEFAFFSVPEPMTWALMIGGFGLAGVSLRRRTAAA